MEEWAPLSNDFVFHCNSCWRTNTETKLIRASCDFSCDSKSNSQEKDSAITAPSLRQLALEAKLVISEIICAWFACGSVVTYTR